MSIQTRFLLALGLGLVACVLALSFAIQTYTVPKLVQWETQEAHAQINRAQRAIERESDHLLIYAREWSVWDDTYRFVQTPYPEYIQANLGAENFDAAKVELLAYLMDDGQVVWAGLKNENGVDLQAGEKLVEEIRTPVRSAVGSQRNAAGILNSSLGPMVIAAHRVYSSQETGLPHGMMLAGRLLNEKFMARLREQTELDVVIAPLADLPGLIEPVGAEVDLAATGEPLVRFISKSKLQLLARFRDLAGHPTLVSRINLSRKVFTQGEKIIRYSLMGTTALFVITLLGAWLLMRRMVFLPIAALARHTSELHDSGDYTRRFGSRKTDELGELAREFDELLNRVQTQADDLKRLSFEDALTGLKNRRFFDEQLRSAWAMLQRTELPLSLLILDVDDFKRYNDRYGHQQGDAALRAVARVTRDVLRRAVDTVARYGGEEFAAILPGTSVTDAKLMAERVRADVMALGLPHETSQVAKVLTVTIGVASAGARSVMEAEELLGAADKALYTAKNSGKNRVFSALEPTPKSIPAAAP